MNHLCPNQVKIIDLQDFCVQYDNPKMLDSDKNIWAVGIGTLFYCQFSTLGGVTYKIAKGAKIQTTHTVGSCAVHNSN